MKTVLFLFLFAPALLLHDWLPCLYTPKPEQLHNWRITCETYGIDNMQPYSHYDLNVIHQHGNCIEA